MQFGTLYSMRIGLGLSVGLGLVFICSYWLCMPTECGANDSFFTMHKI